MHDGRGKNHQAYLWKYSHPAGPVVFDFRLGRERGGFQKTVPGQLRRPTNKATVMVLTITSVAQDSCTPRAGRMPDDPSWKRFDACSHQILH